MKIELEVNGYELHMLEKALNMSQSMAYRESRKYMKTVAQDINFSENIDKKTEKMFLNWIEEGRKEIEAIQSVKEQVLEYIERFDS